MLSPKRSRSVTAPLLRWVGGKQKLARALGPRIQSVLEGRIYVEPFLGAASFFFNLAPASAVLSDTNALLIDCYRWVSLAPKKVWQALCPHIQRDSTHHYYQTRVAFNTGTNSVDQAARFIYLNRTCFNGVYRVNTNGAFNVPYGHKDHPSFPSEADLVSTAKAFRTASLMCRSEERRVGKECRL